MLDGEGDGVIGGNPDRSVARGDSGGVTLEPALQGAGLVIHGRDAQLHRLAGLHAIDHGRPNPALLAGDVHRVQVDVRAEQVEGLREVAGNRAAHFQQEQVLLGAPGADRLAIDALRFRRRDAAIQRVDASPVTPLRHLAAKHVAQQPIHLARLQRGKGRALPVAIGQLAAGLGARVDRITHIGRDVAVHLAADDPAAYGGTGLGHCRGQLATAQRGAGVGAGLLGAGADCAVQLAEEVSAKAQAGQAIGDVVIESHRRLQAAQHPRPARRAWPALRRAS
ncbi:hypothetical protein D9M70_479670 [compost metagenome]